LAARGVLAGIVVNVPSEVDDAAVLGEPILPKNIFVRNCGKDRPFEAAVFHEIEAQSWNLEYRPFNWLMTADIKRNRRLKTSEVRWAQNPLSEIVYSYETVIGEKFYPHSWRNAGIFCDCCKFPNDMIVVRSAQSIKHQRAIHLYQNISSQLALGSFLSVMNQIPSGQIESEGRKKQKQSYDGQWLSQFLNPSRYFARWLGHICLGLSGICLIFGVHYNWSGLAGLFWLSLLTFRFLAAHLLTSADRRSEKVAIKPIIVAEQKLHDVEWCLKT
jgi:hypothetical protein